MEAGGGTQANPPNEGSGANPNLPGSGWQAGWNALLATDTSDLISKLKCDSFAQMWTDQPGTDDNRPLNCVSWYEAFAFCIWDGGRLPTEAEWNYAATGGGDEDGQRVYPWSSPPTSVTIDDSYAVYCPKCLEDGSLLPLPVSVGSRSPKGDGRWGHGDLAGNLQEWVLDWRGKYPMPCDNCARLEPSEAKVSRGGAFHSWPHANLLTCFRSAALGFGGGNDLGFRCARNP
jgi:formylglycine-generating enzyme required for sulfatase activity